MIRPGRILLTLGLASTFLSVASAQSVKRLRVDSSGKASVVTGSIRGRQYVDYVVSLQAGRRVVVSIMSSGAPAEFNVLPGVSPEAMFNSTVAGGKFVGIVPDDGDTVIRVYQTPAMGRRDKVSRYTLSCAVSGTALKPITNPDDAKLGRYHAAGPVECKLPLFPDIKTGWGKVVRRENRSGTVVISAKGFRRAILFRDGKPVASDSPNKMSFRREGDATWVSFEGGEAHLIIDALVLGG